jgi:hypothetical protein
MASALDKISSVHDICMLVTLVLELHHDYRAVASELTPRLDYQTTSISKSGMSVHPMECYSRLVHLLSQEPSNPITAAYSMADGDPVRFEDLARASVGWSRPPHQLPSLPLTPSPPPAAYPQQSHAHHHASYAAPFHPQPYSSVLTVDLGPMEVPYPPPETRTPLSAGSHANQSSFHSQSHSQSQGEGQQEVASSTDAQALIDEWRRQVGMPPLQLRLDLEHWDLPMAYYDGSEESYP